MDSISATYSRTEIGADGWLRRNALESLEEFQLVVATAEAWEYVGFIEITEIREETQTGRRLINAVRFRRLR